MFFCFYSIRFMFYCVFWLGVALSAYLAVLFICTIPFIIYGAFSHLGESYIKAADEEEMVDLYRKYNRKR